MTAPSPTPDATLTEEEKSYGRTDPGLQMRGRWYSEASVARILAVRALLAARDECPSDEFGNTWQSRARRLSDRLAAVERERDEDALATERENGNLRADNERLRAVVAAVEAKVAGLKRDGDTPPARDRRSYPYRMGWWDATHVAADAVRVALATGTEQAGTGAQDEAGEDR